MNEFGLRIDTPEEQKEVLARQRRFTLPEPDGSTNIVQGGYFGSYLDMEGNLKNENELILKYREMSLQAELDKAIQDIINEAIVFNEKGECVTLNLDNVKEINENTKKSIIKEFENLLKTMDFRNKAYDTFRSWYVDGRLYLHCIIDEKNLHKGISSVEWIDPIKIKKIREIRKQKDPKTGMELIKSINEYYVYSDFGIEKAQYNSTTTQRIAPDSVVYVPSGILNPKRTQVLSYLHKAMKPYNQLQMIEIAMVIYRLARAPERRLFYIDVGTMSTQKGNQYVRQLQQNFRNKLVYDAETGEIRDDRKFMSVLEDFWLPRREGGRGTEISTLPGASNLGQIEDVEYARQRLYNALNIPVSRLQPENGFSLGRTTEITRDEVAFSKFIKKLRRQFATLFDELLEKQLILRSIITSSEWKKIKDDLIYDFNEDNNFEELKEAELLRDRIDILNQIDPHVGKYFSKEWVQKNVLKFDEKEISALQKEMDSEAEEDRKKAEKGLPLPGMGQGGGMGFPDPQMLYPPPTSPEGLANGSANKAPQEEEQ